MVNPTGSISKEEISLLIRVVSASDRPKSSMVSDAVANYLSSLKFGGVVEIACFRLSDKTMVGQMDFIINVGKSVHLQACEG
jgi:hypothetical protein